VGPRRMVGLKRKPMEFVMGWINGPEIGWASYNTGAFGKASCLCSDERLYCA
jgi:hypothetical protein